MLNGHLNGVKGVLQDMLGIELSNEHFLVNWSYLIFFKIQAILTETFNNNKKLQNLWNLLFSTLIFSSIQPWISEILWTASNQFLEAVLAHKKHQSWGPKHSAGCNFQCERDWCQLSGPWSKIIGVWHRRTAVNGQLYKCMKHIVNEHKKAVNIE